MDSFDVKEKCGLCTRTRVPTCAAVLSAGTPSIFLDDSSRSSLYRYKKLMFPTVVKSLHSGSEARRARLNVRLYPGMVAHKAFPVVEGTRESGT